MGPMHGFASCLSGCLIFSLETDCSLIGLTVVETPFGGMLAVGELSLAMNPRSNERIDEHKIASGWYYGLGSCYEIPLADVVL